MGKEVPKQLLPTGVGPALDRRWTSVGPVLDQRWAGVGPALDQRWTGVGPALDRHWTVLGPVLDLSSLHCEHTTCAVLRVKYLKYLCLTAVRGWRRLEGGGEGGSTARKCGL